MPTWDVAKQKWRMKKNDPIRYCFVDPKQGASHPKRAWTDGEKKVGKAAIEEWNKSLKKALGVNYDVITQAAPGGPCDVTLRWEDSRFFKDWRQPNGKGADLSDSAGYGSAKGNGSLNATSKDPMAPYTPGRNDADFPEGEAYFNTDPPRPHTVVPPSSFAGWFVDPTPESDGEFDEHGGETVETADKKFWTAKRTGAAANAWDLFTVIKHEFGHMLGKGHKGEAGDTDTDCGQVMAAGAGDRERRHVPDGTVGFNERRHLTHLDEENLHELVILEPTSFFGWVVFWLRRFFRLFRP